MVIQSMTLANAHSFLTGEYKNEFKKQLSCHRYDKFKRDVKLVIVSAYIWLGFLALSVLGTGFSMGRYSSMYMGPIMSLIFGMIHLAAAVFCIVASAMLLKGLNDKYKLNHTDMKYFKGILIANIALHGAWIAAVGFYSYTGYMRGTGVGAAYTKKNTCGRVTNDEE